MKRTLFGLLAGGMALFALSAPTPAKAAVWCGWYGGAWYGRCAVAYTYLRPVVRANWGPVVPCRVHCRSQTARAFFLRRLLIAFVP